MNENSNYISFNDNSIKSFRSSDYQVTMQKKKYLTLIPL